MPLPDHDIEIVLDKTGEFMVCEIVGGSNRGIEFVDAWTPESKRDIMVVDSGRLVIQESDREDFVKSAERRGLKVIVVGDA